MGGAAQDITHIAYKQLTMPRVPKFSYRESGASEQVISNEITYQKIYNLKVKVEVIFSLKSYLNTISKGI